MAVEITWALLLILVGAIVSIIAIAKKMDKKNRQLMGWIGGIAAVVGILAMTGIVPQLNGLNQIIDFGAIGGTTAAVGSPTPGSPLVGGKCVGIEDTTVTLSATDMYTSVGSGGTHRYRINSGATNTVSDGGTFTASPGDTLEIVFENASASGTYFSVLATEVVPCSGTEEFHVEVVPNGTITIDVFNEEGNLISEGTENETVAAAEVVTLPAKLKGTYQKGIPYGGVIVVEYNGSEFDDVIVNFGGSEVPTPEVHTLANVNYETKTYTVPAIMSNAIIEGSIVLDADDTNNPAGNLSDVVLDFRPNNYYFNEDTGASPEGPAVEDEDDTATYGHITSFTIHID